MPSKLQSLKINSWLAASAYHVRIKEQHVVTFPVEWNDRPSLNSYKPHPFVGTFSAYAAAYCFSMQHFLNVQLLFICRCPCESTTDWEFAAKLWEKYYAEAV